MLDFQPWTWYWCKGCQESEDSKDTNELRSNNLSVFWLIWTKYSYIMLVFFVNIESQCTKIILLNVLPLFHQRNSMGNPRMISDLNALKRPPATSLRPWPALFSFGPRGCFTNVAVLHPQKNQRMSPKKGRTFNRKYIFQQLNFRGHSFVFRGVKWWI